MAILNLDLLLNSDVEEEHSYSLNGLLKGCVGMLVAAPSIGKSHLSLSIAIEHATGKRLLGLSADNTPKKVLYISAEDPTGELKRRMSSKCVGLSATELEHLRENLYFFTDVEPLFTPIDNLNAQEKYEIANYREELIKVFFNFDLVIVDTVSAVIGDCNEVLHDAYLKTEFEKMAKESGASLLLVHHINKEEIRGDKPITAASGAGLTRLMRSIKYMFTLEKTKNDLLQVRFLKQNYVNGNESFHVAFDENNLLVQSEYRHVESKKHSSFDLPKIEPSSKPKPKAKPRKSLQVPPEKKTASADKPSSKPKEKKPVDAPIDNLGMSKEEIDKYVKQFKDRVLRESQEPGAQRKVIFIDPEPTPVDENGKKITRRIFS